MTRFNVYTMFWTVSLFDFNISCSTHILYAHKWEKGTSNVD